MHTFKEHGFEKVEGYIPRSFSTFLRNYFAVRVENDPSLVGDAQAPNSNSVYGDAAFDVVMAMSTEDIGCLLYTSPSPRDKRQSRMPSSA